MPAGRVPLEADDERVGEAAVVHRDGLSAVPRLSAFDGLHGGEGDAAGEPPPRPYPAAGNSCLLEQVNLEQTSTSLL